MYNVIHYLLTPDKSASRRLRRIVAENGARIAVVVGTWCEKGMEVHLGRARQIISDVRALFLSSSNIRLFLPAKYNIQYQ